MNAIHFPTDAGSIYERLHTINPLHYAQTRNHVAGGVSYLSPYVSRGFVSPAEIVDSLAQRGFAPEETEKYVQQLAWREYFQRTWQVLGDDIFDDIRRRHTGIVHRRLPVALAAASTGIDVVDEAIRNLERHGYMHNHLRLYTASLACNIGRAWWPAPAQWMYYHLLDGDLASNACSWQWVAGQFSARPYYCNQENINRFTGSRQTGSYLDVSYDELPSLTVPAALQESLQPNFVTPLPERKSPELDPSLPLHLYTHYNLDPHWRSGEKANRVLVLEPSHFRQFPVSEKVIGFVLGLAANITGLQVFCGEVSELTNQHSFPAIRSKEHPAFAHFPGQKDERNWLFPECRGLFPSFYAFWKKASKTLPGKGKKQGSLIRA